MPKRGRLEWVYVGIPKGIVNRIDHVIDTRKWGFKSRSDYVLEAVKTDLRVRGYYP
jgi:metal-responsive CopG/Arc/MetJ family transcriptional regulator